MIFALVALLTLWGLIRLARKPFFLLTVSFLCATRAAWLMYQNHGTRQPLAAPSNKEQSQSRKRVTYRKNVKSAKFSQGLKLISP